MKYSHLALLLILAMVGCTEESAITDAEAPGPPAWLSADGLDYTTHRGNSVTGRVLESRTVEFRITSPSGDFFAFRLGPHGLVEWTPEDRMEIRYGESADAVTYELNGTVYERRASEIPVWGAMASYRNGEPEVPMGIPIDNTLFGNRLGDELDETLEMLGEELQRTNPWIGENGACSGEFTFVLSACMQFKCPWGGLANPACNACIGTFTACLVVAMWILAGGGS